MAWPTTGAGTQASGYFVQGVTTIVWGSQDLLANLGGIASTSSRGIVTRFSEHPLVDNIKLPNGDGLTITRVQIIDGAQWNVTIRDDTGFTVRPRIGNTVLIFDAAGFISGNPSAAVSYIATICEASYDTGPKQAGEIQVTVENLTLITEGAVAN